MVGNYLPFCHSDDEVIDASLPGDVKTKYFIHRHSMQALVQKRFSQPEVLWIESTVPKLIILMKTKKCVGPSEEETNTPECFSPFIHFRRVSPDRKELVKISIVSLQMRNFFPLMMKSDISLRSLPVQNFVKC